MKKIFVLIFSLIICLVFPFIACDKTSPLENNISELRVDVFQGKTENYHLKAFYGYREIEPIKDGARKDTAYFLSFKLVNITTPDVKYTVKFSHNGLNYELPFTLNPVSNSLVCEAEVDNFLVKSFNVEILVASNVETIELTSMLPENTISYKEALSFLEKNHKNLLDGYKDEFGYNLEISLRVLSKNDKPYYYVGLTDTNGKLKAFLLDGITGETLAIRNVF